MNFFKALIAKLQFLFGKIAFVLSLASSFTSHVDTWTQPLSEPHVTSAKWLEMHQVQGQAVLEFSSDLSGTGVTQVVGIELLIRREWMAAGNLSCEMVTDGSWLFDGVALEVTVLAMGDWNRVRLTVPDGGNGLGVGYMLGLDFSDVLPSGFPVESLLEEVQPGGIVILDDMIL